MVNVYETTKSAGRFFVIASMILGVMSMASATGGLNSGLSTLCTQARTFLGISAMVLIVLAGAVYAIGQILGAETRARAAVWATAMLTGAVIGIIIYLVVPSIINAMTAGTSLSTRSDPCSIA